MNPDFWTPSRLALLGRFEEHMRTTSGDKALFYSDPSGVPFVEINGVPRPILPLLYSYRPDLFQGDSRVN